MDAQLRTLATSVSRANTLEGMVRPMLALLQRITRLESTYLTTIDADEGIQHILFARNHGALRISEGADVPWHDTLCRRALEEGCLTADDVPARWADSTTAAHLGLQTYVSSPIHTESAALFGTLCGASQESVRVSNPELQDVLKLFSQLIAHQVDREAQAQRSRPGAAMPACSSPSPAYSEPRKSCARTTTLACTGTSCTSTRATPP